MSSHADFIIRGDAETARSVGERVIREAGFTIAWEDQWTGHAQRGSLPLTLLLGAFVGKKKQAVKVDLKVFAGPEPGTAVVRLTRASSGWTAGAIGASRTKKLFDQMVQELAAPLAESGSLLGVNRA